MPFLKITIHEIQCGGLLDTKSEILVSPPATEQQIAEAEKSLDIHIPDNLRGLLRETDGIVNVYGLQIIWSTDLIKRNNLDIRQSGLAADTFVQHGNLLFFADAGNGDEYAFLI